MATSRRGVKRPAEAEMAQIVAHGHAAPFAKDRRRVERLDENLSSKARNIEGCIVRDEGEKGYADGGDVWWAAGGRKVEEAFRDRITSARCPARAWTHWYHCAWR